ncbi:MAG: heme-binding protein [Candidatus Hydrogenedentes bacterium]|nr:heme-binding protein [Candidatus Hydrogenedentota bacterium]
MSAQGGYAGEDLDLASAQRILNAALAKSTEQSSKMNVTILDAGGHLKAFARMDGAYLGSIDVSMKKAKASILFQTASGNMGPGSQPGGSVYGIQETNGGIVTFAGGVPIQNADGVIIGAIGVSGSSTENDLAVAQAGVAAL